MNDSKNIKNRYIVSDLTWAKCKSYQVIDLTDGETIAEYDIYNYGTKDNAKRLAEQKANFLNLNDK